MSYIKVLWKHQLADEPIAIYCELDDERKEVRKLEVFRDGRHGYATVDEEIGGTRLGWESTPPLEEIASDPQFEPAEITRDEFEQVWAKRRDS